MANAAAALLAIFKVIPALWSIYEKSVELYIKQQNAADEGNVDKVRRQREALLATINQPGTSDEDRASLRRLLFDLHGR